MENSIRSAVVLLSVIVMISTLPAGPCVAWSNDPTVNTAVCAAYDQQYNHAIAADGSGGAVITWQDYRDRYGTMSDIYARKVDATGKVLWTADGVVVSTAPNDQQYPQIVSDGSGGAIIAWQDVRNGNENADIYSQKIGPNGTALWQPNGVAICTAAFFQQNVRLATDGSGGAIITWEDTRTGVNGGWTIYAQRVDAGGTVQWLADGVAVSSEASSRSPRIVSDGEGGAIITWTTEDIYAQRIDANGNLLWPAGGIAISTAAAGAQSLQIASDGRGGAIITWQDDRNGYNTSDIYAQGIGANGKVKWASDVAVSTAPLVQQYPQITGDGRGGAIITWENQDGHIYAQRIGANGKLTWKAGGVPVSSAHSYKQKPQIVDDSEGGAIITWEDYRNGDYHLYAQRINAKGNVLWTGNGVAVSTAAGHQQRPQLVKDGRGGAITTFGDDRSGMFDIYAQKLSSKGQLQPVQVFSPNGGEVIASGSRDQSIEWGAPAEAVSFNLLYSVNNGLTWKTIESGIAGSDYPWNVPLQPGNKTKCKIKVIGYNSSGAKVDEDVSDAPFTIEVLKVTYPDGGEVLGQTDYIRWKFNETLTPVQKIILYSSLNGGTTWQKIRTLESGPYLPGDYEERVEVVPRLDKTSTTSRIKIVLKDKAGKTLGTDISDAFFTIAIP